MAGLEFIDRIQLALHPEIFIPENVASLPNWNTHNVDEVERRLDFFFERLSAASGIPAGMLKGES